MSVDNDRGKTFDHELSVKLAEQSKKLDFDKFTENMADYFDYVAVLKLAMEENDKNREACSCILKEKETFTVNLLDEIQMIKKLCEETHNSSLESQQLREKILVLDKEKADLRIANQKLTLELNSLMANFDQRLATQLLQKEHEWILMEKGRVEWIKMSAEKSEQAWSQRAEQWSREQIQLMDEFTLKMDHVKTQYRARLLLKSGDLYKELLSDQNQEKQVQIDKLKAEIERLKQLQLMKKPQPENATPKKPFISTFVAKPVTPINPYKNFRLPQQQNPDAPAPVDQVAAVAPVVVIKDLSPTPPPPFEEMPSFENSIWDIEALQKPTQTSDLFKPYVPVNNARDRQETTDEPALKKRLLFTIQ